MGGSLSLDIKIGDEISIIISDANGDNDEFSKILEELFDVFQCQKEYNI